LVATIVNRKSISISISIRMYATHQGPKKISVLGELRTFEFEL